MFSLIFKENIYLSNQRFSCEIYTNLNYVETQIDHESDYKRLSSKFQGISLRKSLLRSIKW